MLLFVALRNPNVFLNYVFNGKHISLILIAVQIIKWVVSPPHDSIKLVEVQTSVPIPIGLLEHFPEFLVRQLFANLSRDLLEVLVRDLVEAVLVKELEHFEDLFLGVARAHFGGHDAHELAEVEAFLDIFAHLGVEVPDVLFLDLDSEGLHDGLELARIDFPGVFTVEELEGLLELVHGLLVGLAPGLVGGFGLAQPLLHLNFIKYSLLWQPQVQLMSQRSRAPLYPEEIYDLDTITLEEKVDEMVKFISKLAAGCPKTFLQTLELARLEIEERRTIEQFGLDLEQQLVLFEQYCMYPVEPKPLTLQPTLPGSKETLDDTVSHTTNSSQLHFKKHRKQDPNMLDVLKRTRIDSVTIVSKPTAVLVNKPVKRLRQEKQQPVTRRPSVSQRVSASTKNIPIMPSVSNIKAHHKPRNTTRESMQSSGKTTTESSTSVSIRSHHVNSKPAVHKTPLIQSKLLSKQSSEPVKKSNIININSVVEKIERNKSLPVNKIQFIENDIYSDDDELMNVKPEDYDEIRNAIGAVQKQINQQVIPETIVATEVAYQLETEDKVPEEKIEIQQFNSEKPQETNKQEIVVNNSKLKVEDLQESQVKEQKPKVVTPTQQPTPIYKDTFDYFRLTAPKSRQKEQRSQSTIQVPKYTQNSQDPAEPISQVQTKLQKPQPETIYELQPQTQVTLPEVQPPSPPHPDPKLVAKPQPAAARKSHGFQLHQKLPTQLTKMLSQLPALVNQYQHIIPSFAHLFSPNADYIPLLWQMCDMLRTHLAKVSPKQHFKPNLANNIDQFNVYVNASCNKIKLWGAKVDLDLSGFEHRDDIARMRAANQLNPPPEKDVLYYRVVKTKQQVYDIMSSTFNRTQDWAELPHAMNLKCSWNMLWTWAKPQIEFKKLLFFQKVNHFPHNKHLSRKDTLKKNIEKIKRLGAKTQTLFDIMPESYLLPGENSAFLEKYLYYRQRQGLRNFWIMKPIGMSRGRGISLIKDLNDVIFSEPVVIQKYLKNPLLLDGYKFDMRIYVLLSSINPLQVFLYRQGFARLSTQKYTLDDESLKNNYIHLTNFAIQRQNFTIQGFSLGGTKLSLKMLRQRLKSLNIQWGPIWQQVHEIVLKSCIASMNQIPPNQNCFELFGYDIIIDSQLKCWLLEINSSPSLEREFLLDEIIKQQLIDDTVHILDVPRFDRARLLEVLERRAMENEGRKSLINPMNNSIQQLNRDLHYILHGRPLRSYGQVPQHNGNYQLIAPSPLYFSLIKSVQAYKITSLIRKP